MSNEKESITVNEAGRRGGEKTKELHGNEFFRKIGIIGGNKHAQNLRKYGISPELHEKYSQAGQKGGEATKNKYGLEYYRKIGRKGTNTKRIETGK